MSSSITNANCAPLQGNYTPICRATHHLARHCFVCQYQQYWIILDAKSDKYVCLTVPLVQSIACRLHGQRPSDAATIDCHCSDSDTDHLLESLTAKGILTVDIDEGKPFADTGVDFCNSSLRSSAAAHPTRVSFGRAVKFILACAKIDWQLRRRHFSHTFKILGKRHSRRGHTDRFDGPQAALLIKVFDTLRGFYPRPYLCLFDSLALQEFLAGYDLYPKLVFGVVADPFEAHCWLQQDKIVLNDDLERIARYKSILAI